MDIGFSLLTIHFGVAPIEETPSAATHPCGAPATLPLDALFNFFSSELRRSKKKRQHIPDAPWCWNIYLHHWAISGANVGKYCSTMEHLGMEHPRIKRSLIAGDFFFEFPMLEFSKNVWLPGIRDLWVYDYWADYRIFATAPDSGERLWETCHLWKDKNFTEFSSNVYSLQAGQLSQLSQLISSYHSEICWYHTTDGMTRHPSVGCYDTPEQTWKSSNRLGSYHGIILNNNTRTSSIFSMVWPGTLQLDGKLCGKDRTGKPRVFCLSLYHTYDMKQNQTWKAR